MTSAPMTSAPMTNLDVASAPPTSPAPGREGSGASTSASRSRTPAALPLPGAPEVVTLQAVEEYPAVSVLCSTTPGPRLTPADGGRLHGLVADAIARLRAEFGSAGARELAGQLTELADDAGERPCRSAVALYASSSHRSAWALPVGVPDRAVIDPTFATRDLVRALHRTPRHIALVLTDREARLFDGVGDALLPPARSAFPLRAPERSADTGGRRAQRRATRGGDDDAFLRTVDRALSTHLRLHPAPLVLIGTQRLLARFTALSHSTERLAGTIQGSHARTPLPVLSGLIRPVMEDYLHSRQDEAMALLEQRTSAGRVVSGMAATWLAARAERPEMLAVEQGLFYPARLSGDGDLLSPAEDIDHPEVIDDAVDELIETVLRRGGWIALVEDGALAEHDGVALSIRRVD